MDAIHLQACLSNKCTSVTLTTVSKVYGIRLEWNILQSLVNTTSREILKASN